MRRLFPLCAPLALTLVAAPAAADVVHLKNGGFVRGTIVDDRPGKAVRVLYGDGTMEVFSRDEIARVDLSAPGTPPLPPPPPPGADVSFEAAGDDPFILRRLDEPVEARRPVLCGTPCTVRLPPGTYPLRATARGMQPVEGTIVVRDRPMRVRVESQPEAREIAGILLTFGGAGLFALGTVALLASFAPEEQECDEFGACTDRGYGAGVDRDFARTGGLVMMGVGAVAGIGGAILWFRDSPRFRTYAEP